MSALKWFPYLQKCPRTTHIFFADSLQILVSYRSIPDRFLKGEKKNFILSFVRAPPLSKFYLRLWSNMTHMVTLVLINPKNQK